MSLNIKDEHVHELVRDLARRTGQSQTAAVRDAVERRLASLASSERDDLTARRARLDEIVRGFQADLTDEDRERIKRADEWMYDEFGLPK